MSVTIKIDNDTKALMRKLKALENGAESVLGARAPHLYTKAI